MDFQSEKSFGKLRLRAFQPYHQTLCILKHVGDVRDRSSTPKLHFGSQTLVELHANRTNERCTYVHLKNLF